MPWLTDLPPRIPATAARTARTATSRRTVRPGGVRVAAERDYDGQPTHLIVIPTAGAHVAQEDADWLWKVIRSALDTCTHDNHGGAGYE